MLPLAFLAGFLGALVMPLLSSLVVACAAAYARSRWGIRAELRTLDSLARSPVLYRWPEHRQRALFRRITILRSCV
ncbi:hypothetical protein [uncultured Xylophilus sp.]|uniref:hypothetical protein n=1 Tax=uncultured Xylophilus sp. TaxID=296832 RepID=UPI0025FD972B|nr:hypothetical protein [uncultured Xylophilus sp.]